MKILHFADLHAADKFSELDKCLDWLIATVRKERPDLIVNAGDTFDSAGVKLGSRAARKVFYAFRAMSRAAPMIIVKGTPSHDGEAVEALAFVGDRIRVAAVPMQLGLWPDGKLTLLPATRADTENLSAIITIIPQPTKQYYQSVHEIAEDDQAISAELSRILAGFGADANKYSCPHIVVGHFSVHGAHISERQQMIGREIELTRDQIMLANPDLVCLGHIHYSQQIGCDPIFYAGSVYPHDWGELDRKGVTIHSISGDTDDSRFVQSPATRRARFQFDWTICEIPYRVEDWRLYEHNVIDMLVRIDVRVWQDEAGMVDKETITKEVLELGAKDVEVNVIRVPRANVRSDRLLKLRTLPEKIEEMARLENPVADSPVSESILEKAALLETTPADEIVAGLMSEGGA